MLITASKFAAAQKTVRVKALIDHKIKGVAVKTGDIIKDVPADLARHLNSIGRVEIATDAEVKAAEDAEKPTKPIVANR